MKLKSFSTILIAGFLMAACSPAAPTTSMPAASPTVGKLVSITLPVGYVPDIQFAPLYVAIDKGFYRDQGLDVSLNYSMENDNTVLVGTGKLQFAVVSGEQVLLARAQQLPVVYVFAWYQQYPVGIVAKTSSGIDSLADLKGKKIGLPGLYGANYIGGMALLYSAGLKQSDVTLDSIGFTQVAALIAGKEDAVVIYTANEPLQLDSEGISYKLFKTSDAVQLVANGLITNEATIKSDPDLVHRMVSATREGILYTMAHPDEAYEISKKYVDNLASADEKVQKQVLLNSIDQWKSDHVGYSSPAAWQNMQDLLLKMGLMTQPLDLSQAYNNSFVPQ